MFHASINCLVLFMQEMPCPRTLALDKAGSSMAARMAMTTSSSIKVKARTGFIALSNALSLALVNPNLDPYAMPVFKLLLVCGWLLLAAWVPVVAAESSSPTNTARSSLQVATFDVDATPPIGSMMAYD